MEYTSNIAIFMVDLGVTNLETNPCSDGINTFLFLHVSEHGDDMRCRYATTSGLPLRDQTEIISRHPLATEMPWQKLPFQAVV